MGKNKDLDEKIDLVIQFLINMKNLVDSSLDIKKCDINFLSKIVDDESILLKIKSMPDNVRSSFFKKITTKYSAKLEEYVIIGLDSILFKCQYYSVPKNNLAQQLLNDVASIRECIVMFSSQNICPEVFDKIIEAFLVKLIEEMSYIDLETISQKIYVFQIYEKIIYEFGDIGKYKSFIVNKVMDSLSQCVLLAKEINLIKNPVERGCFIELTLRYLNIMDKMFVMNCQRSQVDTKLCVKYKTILRHFLQCPSLPKYQFDIINKHFEFISKKQKHFY